MTNIKGTYKLYQLRDRLQELEQTIELLEGVDISADLHQEYLELLEEQDRTKKDFLSKVDGITVITAKDGMTTKTWEYQLSGLGGITFVGI